MTAPGFVACVERTLVGTDALGAGAVTRGGQETRDVERGADEMAQQYDGRTQQRPPAERSFGIEPSQPEVDELDFGRPLELDLAEAKLLEELEEPVQREDAEETGEVATGAGRQRELARQYELAHEYESQRRERKQQRASVEQTAREEEAEWEAARRSSQVSIAPPREPAHERARKRAAVLPLEEAYREAEELELEARILREAAQERARREIGWDARKEVRDWDALAAAREAAERREEARRAQESSARGLAVQDEESLDDAQDESLDDAQDDESLDDAQDESLDDAQDESFDDAQDEESPDDGEDDESLDDASQDETLAASSQDDASQDDHVEDDVEKEPARRTVPPPLPASASPRRTVPPPLPAEAAVRAEPAISARAEDADARPTDPAPRPTRPTEAPARPTPVAILPPPIPAAAMRRSLSIPPPPPRERDDEPTVEVEDALAESSVLGSAFADATYEEVLSSDEDVDDDEFANAGSDLYEDVSGASAAPAELDPRDPDLAITPDWSSIPGWSNAPNGPEWATTPPQASTPVRASTLAQSSVRSSVPRIGNTLSPGSAPAGARPRALASTVGYGDDAFDDALASANRFAQREPSNPFAQAPSAAPFAQREPDRFAQPDGFAQANGFPSAAEAPRASAPSYPQPPSPRSLHSTFVPGAGPGSFASAPSFAAPTVDGPPSSASATFKPAVPSVRPEPFETLSTERRRPVVFPLAAMAAGVAAIAVGAYWYVQRPHAAPLTNNTTVTEAEPAPSPRVEPMPAAAGPSAPVTTPPREAAPAATPPRAEEDELSPRERRRIAHEQRRAARHERRRLAKERAEQKAAREEEPSSSAAEERPSRAAKAEPAAREEEASEPRSRRQAARAPEEEPAEEDVKPAASKPTPSKQPAAPITAAPASAKPASSAPEPKPASLDDMLDRIPSKKTPAQPANEADDELDALMRN